MKGTGWQIGFLILSLLGTWGWAAEEIPRVSASLDRTEITVGDRVRLTVEVEAPAGSQVQFPDLTHDVGNLTLKEVTKENPVPSEGGRSRHTLWALLTAYATGPYVISPISVTVLSPTGEKAVLQTLQLFVNVISVIPEGEPATDIRDIKGPVALSGIRLWLWLLIGLLGLIGACGAAFVAWEKRRVASPKPSPPPHVVALEELDRIEVGGVMRRDMKEYYFLVSAVLRRYLEDRFGLRAPEQTTEEFLEAVADNHLLHEAHQELLRTFLESCDLVKFAKHTPVVTEAAKATQTVRDFIHQTKTEE